MMRGGEVEEVHRMRGLERWPLGVLGVTTCPNNFLGFGCHHLCSLKKPVAVSPQSLSGMVFSRGFMLPGNFQEVCIALVVWFFPGVL